METDVMVVAPHPDDAEIGMGGTIAALTQAARCVVVVDLSDGEPTPYGSHEIRLQELKQASEILGIQHRVTLDMANREIFDNVDNRKKLAAVIREYRPKLLFLPFAEDAHPDHIQGSALGTASRFYSKFVKSDMPFEPHYPAKVLHYFCIHIRLNLQPTFLFDTSAVFEKKMQALQAYASQFVKSEANQAVLEKISIQDRYWGMQAGCQYAEPFVCRENIRIDSVEALLGV